MSLEILHPLVNSFSAAEVLVCWFPMIPQTFSFSYLFFVMKIHNFLFHVFVLCFFLFLSLFRFMKIKFSFSTIFTTKKIKLYSNIFFYWIFLCFFVCCFLSSYAIFFFFSLLFFSFQFHVCILCFSDAPHVICCHVYYYFSFIFWGKMV